VKSFNLKNIEEWYADNSESELSGLRILFNDIEPLINDLSSDYNISILGTSENKIPIYKISIGEGQKRILIWSQMHGNESTGTKAIFDLFKFFNASGKSSDIKKQILEACTLIFIPLLNPDGAIAYTRENAKDIDLNRDALSLKAIESKLLRGVLDEFNPHFCFNLHDQRTIFNVEGTENPATISFLAPSIDPERTLTKGRKETMSVIAAMNSMLQQVIPNHVGRYTDKFYPTATGDNFQKLGHNTILIEAGHFPDDYNREKTRKYNFLALLEGINYISIEDDFSDYTPYFEIPNNDSRFLDIIYENVLVNYEGLEEITSIGVLFKYKILKNNTLEVYEDVQKIGKLENYLAHSTINLNKKQYFL
jgi:hypothetical protein|tara:strand:+ start:716 stop:1810 length:1095 start_codon:yes stop_codon:yes gene_type:complete